jgi:hypothetical protein
MKRFAFQNVRVVLIILFMTFQACSGPTGGPEYVTGAVSLYDHEAITIHVTNDSNQDGNTHVVIYKNTGAGAVVVADEGSNVPKTWTWSLAFNVVPPKYTSGEYWVRVQTSSPDFIPTVKFTRQNAGVWTPFVTYAPGDFAIFKYKGSNRYRN